MQRLLVALLPLLSHHCRFPCAVDAWRPSWRPVPPWTFARLVWGPARVAVPVWVLQQLVRHACCWLLKDDRPLALPVVWRRGL